MTPRGSVAWRAVAILVVLVALGLRLYRVEAQSLWYDEGITAGLATRSLRQIAWNAADDIHPPLYYWLLALWARALGDGVFVLRAFSGFVGTALVAAVLGLSRRLLGPAAAVAAGILAALSPYLVWYSQEVRMYALAAAWGAALVWLTLDLVAGRSVRHERRRWIAYIAVAVAALHTHYFAGASAVAIANVVAVIGVVRWIGSGRVAARDRGSSPSGSRTQGAAWWRGTGAPTKRLQPRRPFGFSWRWALAQLVVLAMFLPWLRRAYPTIRDWPSLGDPATAGFLLRESVRTFSLGIQWPPGAVIGASWMLVLVACGAIAGLWGGRRRRASVMASSNGDPWRPETGDRSPSWVGKLSASWVDSSPDGRGWGTAVALAWVATPVLLMWAQSWVRPAWNPKFLIVAAPGFEILAGAGVVAAGLAVARAPRRFSPPTAVLGAGVSVVLIGLALWPRATALRAAYFDPAYQRDDYEGIVRAIDAMAGPRDVVIANAPTQVEMLGYYDRGRHEIVPLPIGRPVEQEATGAALAELGAAFRDVYAVLWATDQSDPEGLVEFWLNENRAKAFDRWYGNVRLALWAEPLRDGESWLSRFSVEQPVSFGENELVLFFVEGESSTVAAGEVLRLDALWVGGGDGPPRTDYTVFLHLVDAAGLVVAQRDMAPRNGLERTSTWEPVAGWERNFDRYPDGSTAVWWPQGREVRDRMALAIPPELPPGSYKLLLGVYDPATGTRLPVRSLRASLGPAAAGGAAAADARDQATAAVPDVLEVTAIEVTAD